MDDSQDYQEYERQQRQERQSHLQSVITFAARLAHHRLLESVKSMIIDVDLTSVPDEHLASSVTGELHIKNVSGCDLVTILDNVNCKHLYIWSQCLGSEETQALVRAMESRVEKVVLFGGVTLDIRNLIEYSGQGKCRVVRCYSDTAQKYREKLRTWASSKNWEVISDDNYCFNIERM